MALNLNSGLTNDVVRKIAHLISRLQETSKDRDSNERRDARRSEIKFGLQTSASGEKRRFREAVDTVAGEAAGRGLEKLENKRKKEAQKLENTGTERGRDS
jgi:hypothetical protein